MRSNNLLYRLKIYTLHKCDPSFHYYFQDQLYWALLSEYVETHIVHSDRPVEFFVEATRSRVGKSLHPKYGLLQIVLEPYLRGKVYDIVSYGKLVITAVICAICTLLLFRWSFLSA